MAALILAACGGRAVVTPTPDPLLWNVRDARFVAPRELVDALHAARFRFIGEVHDHAGQHALRAGLIASLGRDKPAAVMEIFDLGNDDALASAQARGGDADEIATAGALDRTAWRWPLHRPVVAAALAAGLPIRAANVPRAELMALTRGATSAGSPNAWQTRVLAAQWGVREDAALREAIVDSHCGVLPDAAVPGIALAQRIRDAAMAEALARAARNSAGAVLLAGNGHVRRDIGAPRYLTPAELPNGAADIVAVAFVEATADEMAAPDFPRQLVAEHPGYDYLWFTAPAPRPDPCAELKARFAARPVAP